MRSGAAWIMGLWIALSGAIPGYAQAPDRPIDLATLYETGQLVLDANGDGVPDGLGATLVLPSDPSPGILGAAAEVAARLGFETSALDLPLVHGPEPGRVAIVFGRDAWAQSGLSGEPPPTPDGNRGVVAAGEQDGQRWVFVGGPTEEALRSAARLLAGALPHTSSLSDPVLADIGDDLDRWLRPDSADTASGFRVSFSRISRSEAGWILDATVGHPDPSLLGPAMERLDSLAAARRQETAIPDSTTLRYPGVETIQLGREDGEGAPVLLKATPPPPDPGPVPGRPGAGAKNDMDLSNVYTKDGALADSDDNEIPDRIDVVLVPGDAGADRLPSLAARLGLESTGLTVPLVRT
ncbi:MAG: hypothetical protein HKN73_11670, partial [Gemmatimonadetes bacterium]|nr:hypothetical protein [Gemmatimonadota bacterium]